MSYDELLVETYTNQFIEILDVSKFLLTELKPSDWAELNRVMGTDETSVPGPFNYDYTPYLKEVVDCLSHNHPARIIAVMKGGQIGFSTGVIESGIGWIIAQNPGNILFLSGHQELSEEAMNGKIDKMIDSCGLRHLIKPSVLRKRNQRTGDTARSKEFPGGSLVAGSASNHKLLRQRSVRYGFIDDFDGAKKSSEQSGNTRTLIQQRFAAYYDKMKLFYISTPELKENSNIEPVFLLGDQRRYFIPCPCCGEYIPLFWDVPMDRNPEDKGGITWELDQNNKLISGSVKYKCQKCGDQFDDSSKAQLLSQGYWQATTEASEEGYYSYHISCLYAPPGMYDWEYYVRQYLEANPPGEKRKEDLHKTFVNVCLGDTYSQEGEELEAKLLQKNIRNYDINVIPEKLSLSDGNGRIVILTCACDLNGVVDDARLDYEIVAWSETGASYSIRHGSIGTFKPRQGANKDREDREHWSYNPAMPLSVWPELERILGEIYMTDTPNPTPEDRFNVGRKMMIAITGVDTGHYTEFAYNFIDNSRHNVVGVRGDKESKDRRYDADTASFKPAKERAMLYMIDVNFVKNQLASTMKLKWDQTLGQPQPPNFMNFPLPSQGLYLYTDFFEHYESEHKVQVEDKNGGISYRWVKKSSNSQNHFFDVRVYNIALKDIITDVVTKEFKIKKGTWSDFCGIILK